MSTRFNKARSAQAQSTPVRLLSSPQSHLAV
jgi:hypothetical protein